MEKAPAVAGVFLIPALSFHLKGIAYIRPPFSQVAFSPRSSFSGLALPTLRSKIFHRNAADALGLSYWKKNGLVILPQAIGHVIPPLENTFIAFFKDTSLVLIIGIFDLLTTAKTSIIDPAWQSFSVEVYLFVSLIYFTFCFSKSRYSRHLETKARSGR
jgi:ABC-type amino acid transport system permease subunit